MSTQDPFSTTPSQQGSTPPEGDGSWAPAPPPPAGEPDMRTGASGYAAPQPAEPQPAPGFSGGAPMPQHGAPANYYGTPAPAPTSTDGVSIAALVTGILGLSLIPLVLGAVGLRRTAGGIRKGRGMAITGVVLGILSTIAWVIAIVSIVALVRSDEFQTGFQSGFESGVESDPFFSDADTYGDDPELDALWDECAAGGDASCDDLYWSSPLGSEYESFGESCGERATNFIGGRCDS